MQQLCFVTGDRRGSGLVGMPKTKSEAVYRHYPPLRDVSEDEWDEMFSHQGKPWEPDEDEYICEWYGRLDTIEISYALSRLPYSVQERAKKLSMSSTPGRKRLE